MPEYVVPETILVMHAIDTCRASAKRVAAYEEDPSLFPTNMRRIEGGTIEAPLKLLTKPASRR